MAGEGSVWERRSIRIASLKLYMVPWLPFSWGYEPQQNPVVEICHMATEVGFVLPLLHCLPKWKKLVDRSLFCQHDCTHGIDFSGGTALARGVKRSHPLADGCAGKTLPKSMTVLFLIAFYGRSLRRMMLGRNTLFNLMKSQVIDSYVLGSEGTWEAPHVMNVSKLLDFFPPSLPTICFSFLESSSRLQFLI